MVSFTVPKIGSKGQSVISEKELESPQKTVQILAQNFLEMRVVSFSQGKTFIQNLFANYEDYSELESDRDKVIALRRNMITAYAKIFENTTLRDFLKGAEKQNMGTSSLNGGLMRLYELDNKKVANEKIDSLLNTNLVDIFSDNFKSKMENTTNLYFERGKEINRKSVDISSADRLFIQDSKAFIGTVIKKLVEEGLEIPVIADYKKDKEENIELKDIKFEGKGKAVDNVNTLFSNKDINVLTKDKITAFKKRTGLEWSDSTSTRKSEIDFGEKQVKKFISFRHGSNGVPEYETYLSNIKKQIEDTGRNEFDLLDPELMGEEVTEAIKQEIEEQITEIYQDALTSRPVAEINNLKFSIQMLGDLGEGSGGLIPSISSVRVESNKIFEEAEGGGKSITKVSKASEKVLAEYGKLKTQIDSELDKLSKTIDDMNKILVGSRDTKLIRLDTSSTNLLSKIIEVDEDEKKKIEAEGKLWQEGDRLSSFADKIKIIAGDTLSPMTSYLQLAGLNNKFFKRETEPINNKINAEKAQLEFKKDQLKRKGKSSVLSEEIEVIEKRISELEDKRKNKYEEATEVARKTEEARKKAEAMFKDVDSYEKAKLNPSKYSISFVDLEPVFLVARYFANADVERMIRLYSNAKKGTIVNEDDMMPLFAFEQLKLLTKAVEEVKQSLEEYKKKNKIDNFFEVGKSKDAKKNIDTLNKLMLRESKKISDIANYDKKRESQILRLTEQKYTREDAVELIEEIYKEDVFKDLKKIMRDLKAEDKNKNAFEYVVSTGTISKRENEASRKFISANSTEVARFIVIVVKGKNASANNSIVEGQIVDGIPTYIFSVKNDNINLRVPREIYSRLFENNKFKYSELISEGGTKLTITYSGIGEIPPNDTAIEEMGKTSEGINQLRRNIKPVTTSLENRSASLFMTDGTATRLQFRELFSGKSKAQSSMMEKDKKSDEPSENYNLSMIIRSKLKTERLVEMKMTTAGTEQVSTRSESKGKEKLFVEGGGQMSTIETSGKNEERVTRVKDTLLNSDNLKSIDSQYNKLLEYFNLFNVKFKVRGGF